MKKRIACALLTLIMLVSLVPAAALTASAASLTTSESAITVLKQLEGYDTTCNAQGYTGYGTKCTEKGTHGAHQTTEKKADTALREKLKELDTAVNSFASKNGLSLSQNKHDALVLFSFENGTAWTTGTGDFKAAVVNKLSGTDFLNAICRWDASFDDDTRRMIEANMYLYGVYSSSRPSNFIRMYYYPNLNAYELPEDGEVETYYGDINGATYYQYYDLSTKSAPHLTPTMDYHTFTGWYTYTDYGWSKVTKLTAGDHNNVLVAGWVMNYSTPGDTSVSYVVYKSQLLSQEVYKYNTKKAKFEVVKKKAASDYYFTDYALWVDSDYLSEDGVRYCRIDGTEYWVKVAYGSQTGGVSDVDVNVTVTNTYVNRRSGASLYATKNGTYNQGAVLRIIGKTTNQGYVWGQVAESDTSDTVVGWVALRYTDYDKVVASLSTAATSTTASSKLATAVITYRGYVNVRSDAGTDNQLVGALPYGTEVELYETKYVNGIEWGRCNTGWFCLAYANVTRLSTNTSYATDAGYISYAFTGTVDPSSVEIYKEPSLSSDRIFSRQYIDPEVTVTNLTSADGYTWGKISEGWIRVTDNASGEPVDVELDITKYTVSADSLTVRTNADTGSSRVDTLSKGVEFNVNQTKQIVVVGETVWGYADKVGEDNKTYGGWVNLASKYVSRTSAPAISVESSDDAATGQVATIIGADSVRVRKSGSLTATVLGSIARGTKANILGEANGWYMIDYDVDDDSTTDSWVYGKYVSVSEGTVDSTVVSTEGTGIGIICNTYGGVNVRTGPGTANAKVGKILPGNQVNILEVTTVGTTKWGRVEQGWICMDYVSIISDLPADVLASITGSTGTGSTGSGSTTTSEVAIYTGTVNQDVNVRKEPSLNADVVRVLTAGSNITMHEIVTVVDDVTTTTEDTNSGTGGTTTTTTVKQTSYWARVNDGYIYNPAGHLDLDTLDEATYTVTGSDTLNVRDNPGTEGTTKLFKLAKGDQVTITKLQIVNEKVWGYVECDDGEGWASLAYMTKGAVSVAEETPEESTPAATTPAETTPVIGSTGNTGSTGFVANGTCLYTGKVINTNSLNVRVTPSATAGKATTLTRGTSLKIYETCISDNKAWGRCDAGWVYLYYVDLTPASGTAVDARVVYNDNTIIWADAAGTEKTGSTYSRMAVIDIYEVSADGKMLRTELGWVSIYNLL